MCENLIERISEADKKVVRQDSPYKIIKAKSSLLHKSQKTGMTSESLSLSYGTKAAGFLTWLELMTDFALRETAAG